ncbi:MAG: ParB N-terminal domain-containing protein [Alphaproteobacteria bacterium]|nr:ParB N-terminal domain-containing protein [Alphaproteobacteria bacterium]
MSSVTKFTRSLGRIEQRQFKHREHVELPNAIRSRSSMAVPIADIAIEGRLRAIDQSAAAHLAESMDRQGQLMPIHIRTLDEGGYKLAAGAHRILAAKLLGWTEIEAFIIDDLPEDELELLEIDENLYRSELDPFDRARFLFKRKHIYRRMYPETGPGGDRKSLKYQDNIKRQNSSFDPDTPQTFVDATASSTPFSTTTIKRAVHIGEGIIPELQEAIADTPLRKREGDLYRIACMDADEQQRLLARLRDTEEPPANLSALQKDPASAPPRPGNVDRLKKLWTRSSEDERTEFRHWLDLHGDG